MCLKRAIGAILPTSRVIVDPLTGDVWSALIQEIGGEHVRVSVESVDKFGRLLGTVTYQGRDIGEWMVQEGHVIAAYSERYIHVERETREAKRGMWAHAHNFDPRAHRHREPRKG